MIDQFVTIHVMAAGDLFADVLKAITAFMSQNDFTDLLRITALIGIVMVTVGFLKSRDPMVFAKWFLAYVLCTNLLLKPKTSVLIVDISTQENIQVSNVPVVFAATASILTSIGYGLAQSYDMLFATPGDFDYTRTGALFGARLIEAAHDFRITDPILKDEMDHYFRSCVVGDIRLNKKYSVGDLAHSTNIWDVISKKASPLRMTEVNGALVTCAEASRAKGLHSLKSRLNTEIHKAYYFFGINIFGKPTKTTYESLFETHLTNAAQYYQGLTDTSSNIFLQAMMINAMGDGINHYQAFTDNTASVVNHEFTKSQLQHRWSWDILGLKAVWFLPLLHTILLLILFGVFPLVLALSTLPGGMRIISGYLQFFLSLQCWPVLFAVINHAMTKYGMDAVSTHGPMTMVNLDKMTELSRDISGVAGYIMAMIPFLAKGLISNLGEAFNGLATSITGHVQGSGMAVAGEAASASFGLGQTSFYNTSANNFSANKHDTNWTNMYGMHTEQMSSGVLKTKTGSGDTVFDVSPGMTKAPISITDGKAITASLNQAFEESTQAASNESAHYQKALSNVAHRALQLSEIAGHDMRLGDGISSSETAQYSQALATINHIAEDVAQRTGVSREDALAHLTSGGWGARVGLDTRHSIAGKLASLSLGASGAVNAQTRFERSSSSGNKYHTGTDNAVSAREAQDFNNAMNYVKHFSQSHHFDDSHSKAASLSNQLGTDLREAETANSNYDAILARTSRIQKAQSFAESNSDQINKNLDQAFSHFVTGRIGKSARDELYSKPGDMQSVNTLQGLGQAFIASKREALIAEFDSNNHEKEINAMYHQEKAQLATKEQAIVGNYKNNSEDVTQQTTPLKLGFNSKEAAHFQEQSQEHLSAIKHDLKQGGARIASTEHDRFEQDKQAVVKGRELAQKNLTLIEEIPKTWGLHTKGE